MEHTTPELLEFFRLRPGMWIQPINQTTVVAFIHGLEAGANDQRFTQTLKAYLETTHDLYGSNQGWPRQIQLYAEKMDLDWAAAFFELAAVVLNRLESSEG